MDGSGEVMCGWRCDGETTEGEITSMGRSDCDKTTETTETVRQDDDDDDDAGDMMPTARIRRQWGKNCVAGDRAGRAWSFAGGWASKIVQGDGEGIWR